MKLFLILSVIVCTMCIFVCLILSLYQISRCRVNIQTAEEQLVRYRKKQIEMQNEAEAILNKEQVEISEIIYQNAVDVYHRTLHKPWNIVPAVFFGFHKQRENDNTQ